MARLVEADLHFLATNLQSCPVETSPPLTGTLSEGAKSVFGVIAETSTLEHLGNMSKKKKKKELHIFQFLNI